MRLAHGLDRQETYAKADVDPRTGKPLDVGISGQETQGDSKGNDGFFEKGLLKALESDHVTHTPIPEVKVVGHGHCHCKPLQLFTDTMRSSCP